MIEVFGDIWQIAEDNKANAIVVTTNGDVNKQGKAVMGRGIALEAAKKYKSLPVRLGRHLALGENRVILFPTLPINIVTFPVKHHWNEAADVNLIYKSSQELKELADISGWKTVLMPRPGCGNGRLDWKSVKIIIAHLDDRFWVAHNGE